MLWTVNGLEPHLIMPEFMGVLRADINSLDQQEAFVHSTYLTRDQFRILIKDHPDSKSIYKRAIQFSMQTRSADGPDQAAMLKQVIVGGFQPYQGVGGVGAANPQTTNGMVQWLAGPYPSFDPKIITELVRVDELWIRDDSRTDDEGRREWSTFQLVGNIVLFGKEQRMNIFADAIDPGNKQLSRTPFEGNPLAFKQPFVEFCPNRLAKLLLGPLGSCQFGTFAKATKQKGERNKRPSTPPGTAAYRFPWWHRNGPGEEIKADKAWWMDARSRPNSKTANCLGSNSSTRSMDKFAADRTPI